ncbi:phosphoglycerate mutase [Acephala macrosclerotiorum]|nr:phosphoglycerate mutase [Acephala macrosclerotiorum]
MSEEESKTSRVFRLVMRNRMGQNGRFTKISKLPLTAYGEEQVAGTAKILVGPGKPIDVAKLAHVFINPRIRAQSTFELLFDANEKATLSAQGKMKATGKLAEGLDKEKPWDIWRDGCEEGETAQQVTTRLDSRIDEIHAFQSPNMRSESLRDIVIVTHGHLLRDFVKRWLEYPMEFSLSTMMLPPSEFGILGYQEHDINQPAFFLGLDFPPSKMI